MFSESNDAMLFELLSCISRHAGLLSIVLPVLSIVSLIVYRLSLHPLAKYPGPLLARITGWYAVYHAYVGDLHLDMLACHEKYGKSVPSAGCSYEKVADCIFRPCSSLWP